MASTAPPATAVSESSATTGNNNLSKDEVGWYFVEQYYTTLSKSPEKLHLFYNKRSQFVYGLEAEVANVSVGRSAIQERIKALDFQDCKVRISNVDSQASTDCIVIQVIGETSNKSGEPKKFVQTFVLAQQPSGYFVLNDILRYIVDEEAEDVESALDAGEPAVEPEAPAEPAAPVEPEEPAPAEPKEVPEELEVAAIDEKLEEAVSKESAALNGSSTEESVEVPKSPETKPEVPAVDPETTVQELAEEDVKEDEKPKDPTPTPVAKPVPAPAEPPAPPKPMTWASRAAAAAGPKPVVPLSKTPTPPVPSQNRAPAAVAPTSQPAAAAAAPAPAAEATKDTAGWQTAGADSKRQNRPQSISSIPVDKEGTHGYVKYVTDKVQDSELRAALAAHGELTYFDINRQKNCAFVEYKTPEGYQAAVAANPHIVNGENIVVEPRRPKTGTYGGSGYGAGRGGAPRGRGFDGGRSGGQGPRGNFGQNRGRGGAARGRGGAQVGNA